MSVRTWELSGALWRAGTQRGTLVGARGLSLVPGVSRGVWTGRLEPQGPFRRLVASLNPDPWPEGSGIRACVRVQCAGAWSPWVSLGVYGGDRGLPRSEPGPQLDGLRVACDVLELDAPAEALALRLELETGDLGGAPLLRRLVLAGWEPGQAPPEDDAPSPAWGHELEPPAFSQRVLPGELPERGCSPTSLAMVLAHWGCPAEPEAVARAVYDHEARIYGNWSFNVAHAGVLGLRAVVTRLRGFGQLEAELAAGRPVVISHRYARGELSDTPLPETAGHLLVVVGFTKTGDVLVHDPVADPREGQAVRRVYGRNQLRRSWLERGSGIAYLLAPETPEGSP